MKQYTLQDLINTSQYFSTKPDTYIIQKGIKKAFKRLHSKQIILLLRGIGLGILVGAIMFAVWYTYIR